MHLLEMGQQQRVTYTYMTLVLIHVTITIIFVMCNEMFVSRIA